MLKVFTINESEKWDETVRSFDNYDVYWLSGYVKAFKINGDGEPLLFYYEDSNARGINVVMKRDVSKDKHFADSLPENTYFDFATPYGYGGWIIEGENSEPLFNEYFSWCRDNGIVSEFVRFHPVVNNADFSRDFYNVVDLGHTIALDLSSQEVIWANLTSQNRGKIRKAQKAGVEIHTGNSEELYKEFRVIYDQTMTNNSAVDYYFFKDDFYNSIRNDLSENAQIFYATHEDKIIAASIMLAESDKLNYHLSGSLFEYRNMAPINLLLYTAACWGSENGCKTLHLGGGVGSGEDDLYKFKKSFYRKDDTPQFSIGKLIIDESKYDYLVSLRNETEVKDSAFFPLYRA